MWFRKSPAHSDFKSVFDFIPSFNKTKYMEETLMGQQIMQSFITIESQAIQIDKKKILLIFISFGRKFIHKNSFNFSI